uniref:Uncharacterized protein n=1 Tax=Arundo donax TaxID=35708 RepID=A0A0A9TRD5_ARUDO
MAVKVIASWRYQPQIIYLVHNGTQFTGYKSEFPFVTSLSKMVNITPYCYVNIILLFIHDCIC